MNRHFLPFLLNLCLLLVAVSPCTMAQCPTPLVNPISSITLCNGAASGAISFSGLTDYYSWTNSNPSIGLPASGTGNINSFSVQNPGSIPQQAVITVTPRGGSWVYISTHTSETRDPGQIGNIERGFLRVINSLNNSVVANIQTGGFSPQGVSVSPDGSRVYVTNKGYLDFVDNAFRNVNSTLSVINTATNTVTATITGFNEATGVVVSPDGSRIYVTDQGNRVHIIDGASNTFIGSPIPVGAGPVGIAMSPDGSRLYVANSQDGSISVINTVTNTVVATIPGLPGSGQLSVSSDGLRLYSANSNNTASIINTTTNTVVATIPVGANPQGICVSPDGSRLYVANYSSNNVSVINTATNTVVATIGVGGRPRGLSFVPDGSKVYVANYQAYATVINVATNTVAGTISFNLPVGSNWGNFVSQIGCAGTPQSFTITVLPSPTATLTSSGPLTCANPSATLTASGGTSYTFVNSSGILGTPGSTNTLLVTSPDTYSVTVANADGCVSTTSTTVSSNTATITVTNPVTTTATLSTSFSQTFTASGGATPHSFSLDSGTLPTGLILSTSGVLSGTPTQSGSFSITVRATDANGCLGVSATYPLLVNTAAPVALPDSYTTPTNTVLNGSSVLSNDVGTNLTTTQYQVISTQGGTIAMNTDGTFVYMPVLNYSGLDSFNYTVQDNLGQQATATVTINVLPVAQNDSYTTNANTTLNGPSVLANDNGTGLIILSYQNTSQQGGTVVMNSNGTFLYIPAVNFSSLDGFSYTVQDASGNQSTASVTITVNSTAPTVSAFVGSPTVLCVGSPVTVSATVGNVTGSYTYTITNGSSSSTSGSSSSTAFSQNLIASGSGLQTFTLTVSSNGQSATAITTLTVNGLPTNASLTSSTLSCAQTSVTLTASATGGSSYTLSDGQTNNTGQFVVNQPGSYTVTIANSSGCRASAMAQVSQDTNVPTVSISPASATLSCATASISLSAVGNGTYRWSTGATTSSISASSANTYSVTLTGANGCTATASAQIVQDTSAPSASITPSSATLTCSNPSATLTATGSGTYRWSTGATSQTISVGTANTYSLTLTAGNGCTATTSAQVTQDNSVPTVSINPNSATLSCATSSVSLSAIGTGTYRWNTGEITQAISVSTATMYSVTLTSGNGCTATASALVNQDNAVTTVTITANPSLTIGSSQSATLTAGGATTYLWSNGANTSVIVVNAAGTYSVTGTTPNGCSATASVVVSQTAPFAIASVTANTCQQIASNRYVISFTPVYTGTNGQPISFSVVNEVFPTTAPGPYTLQLYTDNPTITLKAQQGGTPGEVTYVYNWLVACSSSQPNTPPRVNQQLTDQIARVGEGFGYTLPQVTFTDNESPQSLVLTMSGLPAGLSFSPPTQIGGVPSVMGVSTVTVTATDPQGLTASTSFVLTVVEPNATNTPPTLANPIPAQVGIQGQPFTLNVGNTFTDAQTTNGLLLTASGLPAGLNLVGTTISGTPSVSGTSTVSLTAVDPGGLSATTSFMLTIQPASVTASGPFAITGVSPLTCTQVANNRYEISFTPRYSGVNGQAINFWVVNELVPTTAPGPYSLQLYNDNPTIVLKARQDGSPGESTFTYNWLASCGTPPQPNTPPRVNIPLTNQVAKVGEGFGYTIPQLTFTDNETPQSLVLSVSGLPAGMNFSPPTQIGGVPSVSGVSSVTVTATDPGGLSVFTTFSLTVLPANAPTGFAITGVQTISCVSAGANHRTITFTPQYSGLDGSPVSFSVVNELLPTTNSGPYTLTLYTDNTTLRLRAQQGGVTVSFDYTWLAACGAPARQGVAEASTGLQVKVLGNPMAGNGLDVEISGVEGQSVNLSMVDLQGHRLGEQRIESASARQRVRFAVDSGPGVLLLQVRTATQSQTVRVVKAH